MPRPYKKKPGDLEPCAPRGLADLERAATLLGDTAVLGCELSFELQSLALNPTHPSRAQGDTWTRNAFVLLQGMLVAERWLIEFLTGPATVPDQHTRERRKHKDDICVECFQHGWRFPEGALADSLVARLDPINKLAAHPTWGQVTTSPRQWTLNRIEQCVDGLKTFADAMRPELPSVSAVLDERVSLGSESLRTGRKDGVRWFDTVVS